MDPTKPTPSEVQVLRERISELEQEIRTRTEQLAESEQRTRIVFDQAFQLMGLLSVEGRLLMVNRTAMEFANVKESEVVGKLFWETPWWSHSEDVKEKLKAAIRRAAAGEVIRYGTTNVNADGELREIDFSLKPIRDKSGSVVFLSPEGRDITDLREAEEALRLERDRAQTYLDLAGVIFVAIGSDETILMVNRKCCEVLGYSEAELVGRNWFDICIPGTLRDLVRETFGKLIRGVIEPVEYFENPVLTKSGEERLVAWHNTVLRDPQGNVTATLSSGEDITERRRAETKLQQAFFEIRRLKEQLEVDNVLLRQDVQTARGHEKIVGDSIAMRSVMTRAGQVAATDSTVLLLGDTGTGKELVARAIHEMSIRRGRPFVAVNCAAVPSTLVESELFGREKGAYTGALTRQIGRFEAADGSTIFLDEIADLSPEAQAKLLRVLEEGQFERLGSSRSIQVDVRVIAATNRDLSGAGKDASFRSDLFYRLNVFPISIPPLREHREDIPNLVWHFVNEFNFLMGKHIENVSQGTMDRLRKYAWPGNVRELRNVIERAMILSTGSTLRVEMPGASGPSTSEFTTLEECQRSHILAALEKTGWRIRGREGAAELLGLKPSTLESKMVKLGIRRARVSPR